MRTLTACQSNYIPWKGYFDLIAAADLFVIYDDVQYTRHDWRNRNRIKTSQGPKWLSIPVQASGRFGQKIHEVEVADHRWPRKHWRALEINYAKAQCFGSHGEFFEDLYLSCESDSLTRLSEINERFLSAICALLEITTPFEWVMSLSLAETDRVERLIEMCQKVGADRYLTGPSAGAYLSHERFERAGIELSFFDYSGYVEHSQVHPPFLHEVTIVDLILNVGDEANRYLKYSKHGTAEARRR